MEDACGWVLENEKKICKIDKDIRLSSEVLAEKIWREVGSEER